MAPSPVLKLVSVSLRRDDALVLDRVDFTVLPGERWLVLGANGSGKTSLLRIAALWDHPTSGRVEVLGETLGSTDVRLLRRRIGYLSESFATDIRPDVTAADAVMTAKNAALETWWHTYDSDDRRRALGCLDRLGIASLADRELATLSSGEMQRVFLARTLMNDPAVVVLDEPSARLDLAGREQLVHSLSDLIADPMSPPLVLVTHHLDEVPPGMTHVLVLRDGRPLASGPIESVLDARTLSDCFRVELQLEKRPNGRYSAWSAD